MFCKDGTFCENFKLARPGHSWAAGESRGMSTRPAVTETKPLKPQVENESAPILHAEQPREALLGANLGWL